jgi:hypothetical protein
MKKLVTAIALIGFIAVGVVRVSYAGEIDILLQKLVEKGVLTAGEAQQIGTETKEQVKKEIAEGKYSSLPTWLQNTKLKGDFRLRYNYGHPKGSNGTTNDQQRGRIRFRLGLESKINDKVTLGAGLATGLGSATSAGVTSRDYARSANQSFTGAFTKKPIELDYAYAKYTPKPWISLIGGKFINPFWDPEGKFIWDDNIRPEGAAALLSKTWNSHLETFLNTGYLVLDQNSGDHDAPMLYVLQPGIKYNFNEQFSLKGAVSYYNWANVKGRNLPGSSYDTSNNNAYGNTRDGSGNVINEFDSFIPQVELGIRNPLSRLNLGSIGLGFLDVPYFSLFGEFLKNNQVPGGKNSTGYVAGFKFGSETIDKWGDWQFQYDFRKIEKDAIPDILPDADFYNSVAGGTTGVGGHRLNFQWGLGKNNWLEFNVYRDQKLKVPQNPETTFLADWKMKF